jgi:hypothetical protein
VRFGLASISYEIDLSAKNAAAFRKQLATFIKHARAARGQRRRAERTASSRERSADIRAWAKEAGIAVSDRGRNPGRRDRAVRDRPRILTHAGTQQVHQPTRPASRPDGDQGMRAVSSYWLVEARGHESADASESICASFSLSLETVPSSGLDRG